ncbi:MAG: SMC-Scp complex subunit ScpB [Chloroflexi bacterium]|nr:SMC-Scp complex subunit ScpB [Chloroflexota bacterium]
MPQENIPRPAPDQLPAIIESLLFVAEEPQSIGTLSKTLNTPRQGIERAIESLIDSTADRGIYVQRQGDRVQLSTTPEAAPYIEHFLEIDHGHLTRASLETLAIIAYRQPATRGTVEAIRGVNSDHGVATLLARGLIEDVGRVPGPGRAVLFGTTIRFLEYFGLQKPEDLPALPEFAPSDTDGEASRADAVEAPDADAEEASVGDDAAEHEANEHLDMNEPHEGSSGGAEAPEAPDADESKALSSVEP